MPDVVAKTVYRLYAMPPTWDAILLATKERYARATPVPEPGYVLIYTDGEKPNGAQEITEDRRELLSDADRAWLLECGASILAEEAAKNKPMLDALSERIEALEKELKRRKEELEKGE